MGYAGRRQRAGGLRAALQGGGSGPGDWFARERRFWVGCFRIQQKHVREDYSQLSQKQCVVEAARRGFFHFACNRRQFFGERGVTYSLASFPIAGW